MEAASTKNIYASRKRRKPAQKSGKEPSVEVAKTNPSKRHRDRLNGELERLARLLPFHQDVITKLDKLTVLRLSVGCLRAKNHFSTVLKNSKSNRPASNDTKTPVRELPEGELLLQVINGFVLVVTFTGTIFYVSSTVQDYLGFQQSDVLHQSVYGLIHTEDRAEFHRQLHWALHPITSPDTGSLDSDTQESHLSHTYYSLEQLPPENSAFLERNFACRLRCLLNNSSGFLAMNFQGRLKFLHGQNEKTLEGKPIPPQLALFALACPVQPPSILEIRAKNFMFKTKHKLDFTPIACDAKGKIVLGYTDAELCYRGSGYQFIHAADMLHCAENHIRMIKTGESGMTVFRLLTKQRGWVWVQANARLIYKNGQPDFIIASQRVLLDEEGEETLRKRSLVPPFSLTTGEAVLYDINLNSGTPSSPESISSVAPGDSNQLKVPSGQDPNSLLGSMLKQDESHYVCSSGSVESVRARHAEDEEEELGGIFSSNWQKSIVSLPETSVFKPDMTNSTGGEGSNSELMSFMSSLGITPEDVEILQQEELFFNIEMDGRYGFEDFTDDVLSYVQESLRKKADFALPSSVQTNLEARRLPGIAPQPQSSLMSWSQGQHSISPLMSQQQHSSTLQTSNPKMQQFIPKQYFSQSQLDSPMQEHNPAQPCLYRQPSLTPPDLQFNPQHQSLHPVNHTPVYQTDFSSFVTPETEAYNRLKHTGSVSVRESSCTDQQLPAVVHAGSQEPGNFYLETNHLPQGFAYMNQVNTVSVNFNQELAPTSINVRHSHVGESLEELLTCLDAVGQERHRQSGEHHEEAHPPCAQSHLNHNLLHQPYTGQIGALGNLQVSFEKDSINNLAQTPQHSSDNSPYPDLSLGYM